MPLSRKQIVIILAVVAAIGILVYVIRANIRSASGPEAAALTVWGHDEPSVMAEVIGRYAEVHPNVEIAYEKIDPAGYRERLLNALAAGSGPDVFLVRNQGLLADVGKIVPAPADQFGVGALREQFPRVVEQDFVLDGEIYALPIHLDTLALIYNRDLFDQAGVVEPPKTWDDLARIVPVVRTLDANGRITRAAAAIGATGDTVNAGVDLLNLLMLQNGATMTDAARTRAQFASSERGSPGLRAFDFYLQFANPGSSLYTWDDNQPSSLESFASGKVAMIFGYHADAERVRSRSPFLNFDVAPVPQPSGESARVDYADYWGLAVSKQSAFPDWAWNFIAFFATDQEAQLAYLLGSGRLPALRSLIAANLSALELGTFVRQSLTARSWYHPDVEKVKDVFNAAIRRVLTGQANSSQALSDAESQVTELLRAR